MRDREEPGGIDGPPKPPLDRAPEPVDHGAAASPPLCDLCGAPMREIHCKLICDRCGYIRDCSDP